MSPSFPPTVQTALITRAALENAPEGAMSFLATQRGWAKEEVPVYTVTLFKELRTKSVHSYYSANIVYAQKPLDAVIC